MTEYDALVFLVVLSLLLGAARILSTLGRALVGAPNVTGGVVAGLLFGKSVLSHVWPAGFAWLGGSHAAWALVDGYAMVASLLLLAIGGLEVDLSVVRRRGRSALPLVTLGILTPLGAGALLSLAVAPAGAAGAVGPVAFAALLGVALTVSALPVIARTLADLGLFKTDVGLLVMAAASAGDVFGWLAFCVVLAVSRGAHPPGLAWALGGSALFAVACVQIGKRLLDRALARIDADPERAPGRTAWLLVVAALLASSATLAAGLGAVLGAFFVGVAFGDTPRLRVRARVGLRELVLSLFAPVFYASAALHVDFARAFDPKLTALVLAVAVGAKVVGCGLGARLSGLRWREAGAVGFALNSRGSLEMILAVVTLRAGLIDEPLFVAIVTMTLVTSIVSGPVMKRLLYRAKEEDVVELLVRSGAFVPRLEATLPMVAIEELVHALAERLGALEEKARVGVIERELVAATGLGDEIAIPHAAVPGLERPLVALGRAPHGIDFDSSDGKPAKIIFLILMPPKAYEEEVQILASIARAVFDGRAREDLMAAATLEDVTRVLGEGATRALRATRRAVEARAGA